MIGVLNTRPREQATGLSARLRQAGYEPHEVALVELVLKTEELNDPGLFNCDGVIISSPNLIPLLAAQAPAKIRKALAAKPWDLLSAKARPQAEAFGAGVAFVPKQSSLEGFLAEFPRQNGLRLLHLCSSKTRLFPEDFTKLGVTVINRVIYAPRCPDGAGKALETVWPEVKAVLFASGSAVNNLFSAAPGLGKTLVSPMGPVPVSIGPSATEALRARGAKNFPQAPTADDAGLIAALNTVNFRP